MWRKLQDFCKIWCIICRLAFSFLILLIIFSMWPPVNNLLRTVVANKSSTVLICAPSYCLIQSQLSQCRIPEPDTPANIPFWQEKTLSRTRAHIRDPSCWRPAGAHKPTHTHVSGCSLAFSVFMANIWGSTWWGPLPQREMAALQSTVMSPLSLYFLVPLSHFCSLSHQFQEALESKRKHSPFIHL